MMHPGGFRPDMQAQAGPSLAGQQPMGPGAMAMSPQQMQQMGGADPMGAGMLGAGMAGGRGGGTTYTGPYPWKQGVCECTQSGDICMEGLFCMPCLYGSTVSKVQGVPCVQPTVAFALSMICCACSVVGAKSRKDIRVKFNLVSEPFSDCMTYLLYPFCTVCQEAYELRARGFGSNFGPMGGMGGMGGMGMGMGGPAMMSPPGQMQMQMGPMGPPGMTPGPHGSAMQQQMMQQMQQQPGRF